MHRIEVTLKNGLPDTRGQGLVKDIYDLGITSVSSASVIDVYWLDANLYTTELETICQSLLADPVIQEYHHWTGTELVGSTWQGKYRVEVAYNAGVTDPVEGTVMKAVQDLGIKGINTVKTGKLYLFEGSLKPGELETISQRLLVNPIIQHVVKTGHFTFPENPQYRFEMKYVNMLGTDETTKNTIKRKYNFTAEEYQAVADYFTNLGRNPTDVEVETIYQTWSEHCGHKTFKAKISFENKVVDNLLKSTIAKATIGLNKPWCISVFEDNAGVIDFDGQWAVCFKVETHNHPSAVEPYGGASTGLGGVIRDPLGTGLGSKPILNTDVFCFAPPDFPYDKLPKGALHPRRVFKGVRAGVADYGNRMGIPTVNGAVLFDDRYVGNPLVYCGTVGLMPKKMSHRGNQRKGDLVVLIGGRTGRDGIHGVTFASEKLTQESGDISFTSVQIGNPIVEKKFIDVLLQARDRGLYRRITDCGGGGLSSAVGEMGESSGVRVDLDKVPLKYAGLSYTEIWISEAQERMVLAVPPEHVDELISLFESENVEAAVIGEFTEDHNLQLFYEGKLVGEIAMEFLHQGHPQFKLQAVWTQPRYPEPDFDCPVDLTGELMRVLGSWNVCSKEWVIRQYDHEVQGGSVLKPLVGIDGDGPGDAAIIRPLLDSNRGVVVSSGICPSYADIDPYWMAASAIDEALRQIIAVGGTPDKVALLDNFCWGRADRPEMLGALVKAAQACHDMSLAYSAPFISGKDSLNNEFEVDGRPIAIPHTLLVSAIGIMPDVTRAVSMDLKQAGDLIYIVGETYAELGGSEYLKQKGFIGNNVPKVNPEKARKSMDCLSKATTEGLIRACHDCSDGGTGVAIAEMAFAGGLGVSLDLKQVPLGELIIRDDFVLFSESNSRFLVEVTPEKRTDFEKTMKESIIAIIGHVTASTNLEITGLNGQIIVATDIHDLKKAWQKPLKW
jgi:phosphoribosylformylglycinamidine synthase subunit PurSL